MVLVKILPWKGNKKPSLTVQWPYRTQLLLTENFSQYPAVTTCNIDSGGNFNSFFDRV